MYYFIIHISSWCKSIKIPLNAVFCSAVFWWLIWLRNHTTLPQQKQRGAQMNRSRPPNLPFVEKECATRFLLNSFISVTFWVFFCRTKWKKSVKKYISELRKAFWKVYFQCAACKLVVVLCSVLVSACTNNSVVWAARSMDVMVCTSEWQEGCLSCSSSPGYWHLSP